MGYRKLESRGFIMTVRDLYIHSYMFTDNQVTFYDCNHKYMFDYLPDSKSFFRFNVNTGLFESISIKYCDLFCIGVKFFSIRDVFEVEENLYFEVILDATR